MAVNETDTLCSCGKSRTPHNLELVIGRGALAQLPRLAAAVAPPGEAARPVALFDTTTFKLFGDSVLGALGGENAGAVSRVLGEEGRPFEPDEAAIEAATEAVRSGRNLIVGVGSGAINDLGKYISSREGVPYISVATAPSMDGFAAPISAIVVNKVKTTVDSRSPDAVVGDLDILSGAPVSLISAGFGDVLGKLTSLTDWKLAHVLFDEYWCPETAEEVGSIARRVMGMPEAIARRSPEAVGDLMEALVRAGSSVIHIGYSRPTSGAEHLVSHFIEMWCINRGLRPPAHGHVVGVGTLIVSRVAEALKEVRTPLPAAPPERAQVREILDALKIDEKPSNFGSSKFDAAVRDARRRDIEANWSRGLEALAALPPAAEIARVLKAAGCPTRLSELGVERETARQAIAWCRFLRERYTMFDLAGDAGVLQELIDGLVEEYA